MIRESNNSNSASKRRTNAGMGEGKVTSLSPYVHRTYDIIAAAQATKEHACTASAATGEEMLKD